MALFISTAAYTQEIMPDVITDTISQSQKMTPAEIKSQKKDFVDFITKYRNSEFIGHTQYALSALNLSIRANAKYSIETDGTVLFQLATDGNHYISASDVTFPMQGSVYFEVKNKAGVATEFITEEGQIVTLEAKRNTFYIVESEKSFNLRKNVQSKFNRADRPIGRFVGITRFDLFSQDVEFYEIQDGRTLLRRGSFNGNAAPRRTNW
jgi:hypothetical protein